MQILKRPIVRWLIIPQLMAAMAVGPAYGAVTHSSNTSSNTGPVTTAGGSGDAGNNGITVNRGVLIQTAPSNTSPTILINGNNFTGSIHNFGHIDDGVVISGDVTNTTGNIVRIEKDSNSAANNAASVHEGLIVNSSSTVSASNAHTVFIGEQGYIDFISVTNGSTLRATGSDKHAIHLHADGEFGTNFINGIVSGSESDMSGRAETDNIISVSGTVSATNGGAAINLEGEALGGIVVSSTGVLSGSDNDDGDGDGAVLISGDYTGTINNSGHIQDAIVISGIHESISNGIISTGTLGQNGSTDETAIQVSGSITTTSSTDYSINLGGTTYGSIVNTGEINDGVYISGDVTAEGSAYESSGASGDTAHLVRGLTIASPSTVTSTSTSATINIGDYSTVDTITVDGTLRNTGTAAAIAVGSTGAEVTAGIINNGSITGDIDNDGVISGGIDNNGSFSGDIENSGTINGGIDNSTINFAGNIVNETTGNINGVINNSGTITGNIDNDGTIHDGLTNSGTLTGNIDNDGIFTGVLANSGTIAGNITNAGTINTGINSSGTLNGAVTNSGTISGGLILNDQTASGASAYSSSTTTGTTTLTGGYQVNGTVTSDQDTVVIGSNASVDSITINTGGTLSTTGVFAAGAPVTNVNGDAINIAASGSITGALTNDGTITGDITNAGTIDSITNSSTGTLTGSIDNSGTVTGAITSSGAFNGAITNAGTGNIGSITVHNQNAGSEAAYSSTGTATLGSYTINGNVTSTNTNAVSIGTGTSTGAITINDNGSLTGATNAINNMGTVTGGVTSSGTVSGTITNAGDLTGGITNSGTHTGGIINSGSLAGGIANSGTHTGGIVNSGTLAGGITNTGTHAGHIFNSGSISDGITVNNQNSGSQTLYSSEIGTLTGGYTVNGTAQSSGASAITIGRTSGADTVPLEVDEITVNGTLKAGSNGNAINLAQTGDITTITVASGGTLGDSTDYGGSINNAGTIGNIASSGTIYGGLTNSGSITNGATINNQTTGSASSAYSSTGTGSLVGGLTFTGNSTSSSGSGAIVIGDGTNNSTIDTITVNTGARISATGSGNKAIVVASSSNITNGIDVNGSLNGAIVNSGSIAGGIDTAGKSGAGAVYIGESGSSLSGGFDVTGGTVASTNSHAVHLKNNSTVDQINVSAGTLSTSAANSNAIQLDSGSLLTDGSASQSDILVNVGNSATVAATGAGGSGLRIQTNLQGKVLVNELGTLNGTNASVVLNSGNTLTGSIENNGNMNNKISIVGSQLADLDAITIGTTGRLGTSESGRAIEITGALTSTNRDAIKIAGDVTGGIYVTGSITNGKINVTSDGDYTGTIDIQGGGSVTKGINIDGSHLSSNDGIDISGNSSIGYSVSANAITVGSAGTLSASSGNAIRLNGSDMTGKIHNEGTISGAIVLEGRQTAANESLYNSGSINGSININDAQNASNSDIRNEGIINGNVVVSGNPTAISSSSSAYHSEGVSGSVSTLNGSYSLASNRRVSSTNDAIHIGEYSTIKHIGISSGAALSSTGANKHAIYIAEHSTLGTSSNVSTVVLEVNGELSSTQGSALEVEGDITGKVLVRGTGLVSGRGGSTDAAILLDSSSVTEQEAAIENYGVIKGRVYVDTNQNSGSLSAYRSSGTSSNWAVLTGVDDNGKGYTIDDDATVTSANTAVFVGGYSYIDSIQIDGTLSSTGANTSGIYIASNARLGGNMDDANVSGNRISDITRTETDTVIDISSSGRLTSTQGFAIRMDGTVTGAIRIDDGATVSGDTADGSIAVNGTYTGSIRNDGVVNGDVVVNGLHRTLLNDELYRSDDSGRLNGSYVVKSGGYAAALNSDAIVLLDSSSMQSIEVESNATLGSQTDRAIFIDSNANLSGSGGNSIRIAGVLASTNAKAIVNEGAVTGNIAVTASGTLSANGGAGDVIHNLGTIQGDINNAGTLSGHITNDEVITGNIVSSGAFTGNIQNNDRLNGSVAIPGRMTGHFINSSNARMTGGFGVYSSGQMVGSVSNSGTIVGNIINDGTMVGNISNSGSQTGSITVSGVQRGNVENLGTLNGNTILSGTMDGDIINSNLHNGAIGVFGSGELTGSIQNNGRLTTNISNSGQITGNINNAGTIEGAVYNSGTLNGVVNNLGTMGTASNLVVVDFSASSTALELVQSEANAVIRGQIKGSGLTSDIVSIKEGTFEGSLLGVEHFIISDDSNISIDGNFVLPPKTTVHIDSDLDASNPLITASGTAYARAAGSEISFKPEDNAAYMNLYQTGPVVTVVDAQAVDDETMDRVTISTESALLQTRAYEEDGDIKVEIRASTADDIDGVMGHALLSALLSDPDSESSEHIIRNLNRSEEEVAELENDIRPDTSGSTHTAPRALALATQSIILDRITGLRSSGLNFGDDGFGFGLYGNSYEGESSSTQAEYDNTPSGSERYIRQMDYTLLNGGSFWGQVMFLEGNQDAKARTEGYNNRASGVVLGIDGIVLDRFRLGLSATYGYGEVNTEGGRSTESHHVLGTIYGSWEYDRYFVDILFSGGTASNSVESVVNGVLSEEMKLEKKKITGDYNSHQWNLKSVLGVRFDLSESWEITPLVELNYGKVFFDSYKPKGDDLHPDEISYQDYSALELGLGFLLKGHTQYHKQYIEPDFSLMAHRDINTTGSKVEFSFPGVGAQSLKGPTRDAVRYTASFGLYFDMGSNWYIRTGYDYNWSQTYRSHGLNAKFRYDF